MKMHPSHEWYRIPEEPEENWMCDKCPTCTCHSPEMSSKECDMTGGM